MSLRRAIPAAIAAMAAVLAAAPAGSAAVRGDANGRLAFDRGGDIWANDAPGSAYDATPTQLTSGSAVDAKPSWTAPLQSGDEQAVFLAFQRTTGGKTDIYKLDVGGGTVTQLTDAAAPSTAPAWAPDVLPGTPGEFDQPPPYPPIAFERAVAGKRDIYVMNADGSGQVNVTNTPTIDESNPDWVPGAVVWTEGAGGPYLSFDSDEAGVRQVYVMSIAYDGTTGVAVGPRRPVTTGSLASADPSWFAFTPEDTQTPVSELEDQIAFAGPDRPGAVDQIGIADYIRRDPTVADQFAANTAPFSQPGRIDIAMLTAATSPSTSPAWSPVGNLIAFVRDGDVQVLDPAADVDAAINVTQSPGSENHPDWESAAPRSDEAFPRRPIGRRSRQRTTSSTSESRQTVQKKGRCTKSGNRRANVLRGTRRRDVICGGGGNDVILGLGGNDLLIGGAGKDRISGGRGKDVIQGGPGNDRLFGGAGKDRIEGGRGRDTLIGPRGRDRLIGVERRRRA